ncbi:transposase [Pseudoalteromonas shioyasakiensis]|uniref:Transposase n=1 Tax=Pseudoalteromonas shioyasakiensis TaxID=1190813 RepID=A0ABT6U0V5_9GAMM|nr:MULTISPECIES: transposase [Pseudoalteromonas]MDI4669791.1 transposase [Pseudoalteromonas shioyasakiensis]MDI4674624.1 transposase [Pseudoalteromonas shioyasakiensis]MDI4686706.1 transposase [Pseudoalteromonas shioyasakiensis]MDI4705301.1 transposase [Pseudoalteromonas shioyasakiensis]NUJ21754.1 transposase [Pseudoalteromonas sp. 0802]
MATPRRNLISVSNTPYYHCISRCVRRAYLCGQDPLTGRSYEHRRDWVEKKLFQLGRIFCIDICAYAVMSNHTHLVLHIDIAKAKRLNNKAILIRWHKLFKSTFLCQRFLNGELLTQTELAAVNARVNLYRERLSSISWFMRVLNEGIARKANLEDECKGRFWEGRFKSQALLDEAALAACLAYVDLNPVRAKAADLPEESDYTSIKSRIYAAQNNKQPKSLMRFAGKTRKHMPKGLPFELKTYLQLVDWTGRSIREDKPGTIPENALPILERLDICTDNWLTLTTSFTRSFKNTAGKEQAITAYANHMKRKRRSSISTSRALFA